MNNHPDPSRLHSELSFQASRSSGAGGQNVNKVNTRVELRFNIPSSSVLTTEEKDVLLEKLASRISKDGDLIITSEQTRSQYRNREDCLARFDELIIRAFEREKPRIATRPRFSSRIKRLERKKQHSDKKQNRKKPDL